MADDELTVRIRGLEAYGRHGVYAPEQELGQRFVVDLDIRLSDARSADTDDLALTVRLWDARRRSRRSWAASRVHLLERLASLIADRVLAEHPGALRRGHRPQAARALPQVVTETAVTLTRHA